MSRWLVVFVCACAAKEPAPTKLAWESDEARAFERARAEHRAVAIELWASWAIPSEELDRTLHAPAVEAALAPKLVPVKLDVSTDSEAVTALRQRYKAQTLPAVIFVTTDGRVLGRIDRVTDEAGVVAKLNAL